MYMYSKSRHVFGRPCDFQDEPAILLHSQSSNAEQKLVRLGSSSVTFDTSTEIAESTVGYSLFFTSFRLNLPLQ